MPSNLVLQAFSIRFSCFLAYTAEIIREISDGLSGGSREIAAWAAAGPLGPAQTLAFDALRHGAGQLVTS